jgi:hypothetical protein
MIQVLSASITANGRHNRRAEGHISCASEHLSAGTLRALAIVPKAVRPGGVMASNEMAERRK